MKKLLLIASIMLCCALSFVFAACGDKDGTSSDNQAAALQEFTGITFEGATVEYDGSEHAVVALGAPEDATITYTQNKGTNVGTYNASVTIAKEGYKPLTLTTVLKVTVPSAQSVVAARAAANASADVQYDFHMNMSGTASVAGFGGTVNANYDGKYRYNRDTGALGFVRTTSGALLYDATEYITVSGDTKIKVTANDKGKVKKVNVLSDDGEELMLINKPVAALVDALQAGELTDISLASESADYMFKANIRFSADNALLNKLLNIVAKQGSSVSMKGVSFTNPVSGFVLYFNMTKDKKLNDFALSAEIRFPIKGVPVTLGFHYSQTADDSAISLSQLGNVIIDRTAIAQEVANINTAIDALRAAADYSLDVEAKNQFDPGWNVRATTDRYTAHMYKHSYQLNGADFVAFNQSFEYKTHHEEDSAETYKYTIGNIQDGSVYLISRKGTNTQTALPDVSADTQFDYLTSAFRYTAADVDCIRKVVSGTTITYDIYLNNAATVSVNQTVSDMINSNDAEGVVDVNNYFDSTDYEVTGSDLTIVLSGGVVSGIEVETETKYYPVGGEYTDKRITLTDTLTLTANAKLSDAKDYTAPKNVESKLGSYGLNNAKFYIQ